MIDFDMNPEDWSFEYSLDEFKTIVDKAIKTRDYDEIHDVISHLDTGYYIGVYNGRFDEDDEYQEFWNYWYRERDRNFLNLYFDSYSFIYSHFNEDVYSGGIGLMEVVYRDLVGDGWECTQTFKVHKDMAHLFDCPDYCIRQIIHLEIEYLKKKGYL